MFLINGKKYVFKLDQEFLWLLASGVIPILGTALFTFDVHTLAEGKLWLFALTVALVRALGGATIAWWTKRKVQGAP